MNANEISPKANDVRLNRIKKVSYFFRIIFLTATGLGIVWTLTAIFECLMHHKLGHYLFVGFTFTWTLGAWSAYKLCYLYSIGDLFTSKSIQSIKRIGYSCVFLGLQAPLSIRVAHFGMKDPFFVVFSCLIIIFIAWIMDEGRKIQEEQELPV